MVPSPPCNGSLFSPLFGFSERPPSVHKVKYWGIIVACLGRFLNKPPLHFLLDLDRSWPLCPCSKALITLHK